MTTVKENKLANNVDPAIQFIPEEAIKASAEGKEIKTPTTPRTLTKRADEMVNSDPFNEDRVSRTEPSDEVVRKTAPDDTVNPG